MQIYRREAVELATRAASKALDDYAEQHGGTAGQAAASLTHLIVVTCTGFFAPGLDQALATALELPADVERTVMGLMGSAAAFNGLRLASEIVHGSPAARVLVVCVELCVIHQQPGADQQPLIASSLFADGAAACLVAGANTGSGARFEVDGFYSRVEPNTPKDMQRKMDDYGVVLQLSSEIPEYLGEVAPRAVRELFGVDRRPNFWAIHPGGRAIIDRLQETFELKPEDLSASREVLRRYGNMSSSTILFVLTELRRQLESQRADRHTGVAMAFEPGLVVEMASLRYLSA
jgi:predicted naringenin-chalcone synthase